MLSTSVEFNWLALIWKKAPLIASPLSKHTQRYSVALAGRTTELRADENPPCVCVWGKTRSINISLDVKSSHKETISWGGCDAHGCLINYYGFILRRILLLGWYMQWKNIDWDHRPLDWLSFLLKFFEKWFSQLERRQTSVTKQCKTKTESTGSRRFSFLIL